MFYPSILVVWLYVGQSGTSWDQSSLWIRLKYFKVVNNINIEPTMLALLLWVSTNY